MKIDGNKFMKWLHKTREKESRRLKRLGRTNKRIKDSQTVSEIIKQYGIPIVKV